MSLFIRADRIPRTSHHHKGVARSGRMYDKRELVEARKFWETEIGRAQSGQWAKEAGQAQTGMPLRLSITFYFRAPKARKLKATETRWSVVKPDLDNMAKTVQDCLVTCGVIAQDQQVAWLEVRKFEWGYGHEGCRISVTPLGEIDPFNPEEA